MIGSSSPAVSIGLPVYNGARYLSGAIEAILAQTYENFELIICDNASSDETPQICERFARQDPRIRYVRQPRNVGAAANFNQCVVLAGGRYFKWAAHDDLIEPEFLERCVGLLESNPDAVLCQSMVQIIDQDGRAQDAYDPATSGTGSPRPVERFAGRLRTRWCEDIFGVIRTGALRESGLIGTYPSADRALLAELALRGRFVFVPELLFSNREHVDRSTRGGRRHIYSPERYAWFAPDARRVLPTWSLLSDYARLIPRHLQARSERLAGYVHLMRWLVGRRLLSLLIEAVLMVAPRLLPVLDATIDLVRKGRTSVQPSSTDRAPP